MSKKTMNMAKTVGIGLIAGTAAMTVGSMIMNQNEKKHCKHSMRKSAGNAMHTMSEILNTAESMLKN